MNIYRALILALGFVPIVVVACSSDDSTPAAGAAGPTDDGSAAEAAPAEGGPAADGAMPSPDAGDGGVATGDALADTAPPMDTGASSDSMPDVAMDAGSPADSSIDADAAPPTDAAPVVDVASDAAGIGDAASDAGTDATALLVVNGCTSYEDHTSPMDGRIIPWTFSIGTSPTRCMLVRAGQMVTWSGSLTVHPLGTLGGDTPNPIAGVDANGMVNFPSAGVFGYTCLVHPSMNGAIAVVP